MNQIPVPFAFAPTRSGRLLVGAIDQPMTSATAADADDSRSISSEGIILIWLLWLLVELRYRNCISLLHGFIPILYFLKTVSDEASEASGFSGREERNEQPDRHELMQERLRNGDWCSCGRCFPPLFYTSVDDLTCCQESPGAVEACGENVLFHAANPYTCITDHPVFFNECLYRRGLDGYEHVFRRLQYAVVQTLNAEERRRYCAYRRYTVWIHGYLGMHIRREIPQCVTRRIRETFPAENPEAYRGFTLPDQ